jgi:peptide/nickel transport system permease protein
VYYAVRRTLLLLPTVMLVTALVFVALRLIPGDVVTLLVRDQNVAPADAERLRRDLGLDAPLLTQYATYLSGLARGDLGRSIWTDRSVAAEFGARVPVTLELTVLAILCAALLGVPAGVVAAVWRNRWPDYLLRLGAVAGLSLPGFWLGTLAIVLPAVWWGSTPPLTYVSPRDDLLANLRQFLVPAFLMSLYLAAVLLRLTRTLMLDVLAEDFIRTARAKGLSERRVIAHHALRNALIPAVTVLGTQSAALLGGTVIFEQIFNLQGVGSYLFQAVSQRDYQVIQSVNVLLATAVLLVNLAVDLTYGLLDPRVRLGR